MESSLDKRIEAEKAVFVTVGTTAFDELIQRVDSLVVRKALYHLGYNKLVLQIGRGAYMPSSSSSGDRITVDTFTLKDDIIQDIMASDLVISHAGAGTILETLRAQKPLLVVINEKLMGNHQQEVAKKLSEEKYLFSCTCSTLEEALRNMDLSALRPFPKSAIHNFASFMDKLMGFD